MNNYPVEPPSYEAARPANANKYGSIPHDEEAGRPLLSPTAGPSSGAGGYFDEPAAGDLPDDFKVSIPSAKCSCLLTTTP